MKNMLLTLLFISIFSLNGFSQSNWSLKGGLTSSYFTNAENSSPNIGFTLGIARKFTLKNNFSICGEVDFAIRNATLKDRAIMPYERYDKSDAYLWDIQVKIGFIDIPVLFQYSLQLNNKTNLVFFAGPSISIPILDFSELEKKEFYEEYDPNNPSGREYDFWFGDGEKNSAFWSNDTKIIYNFGFDFSYLNYIIELRYVLDKRNVYRIDNISEIHNEINSIYLYII